MKRNLTRVFPSLVVFAVVLLAFTTPAAEQVIFKTLTFSSAGPSGGPFGHTGQAGQVQILAVNNTTRLNFSLSGLTPSTVHSAWLSLDTTQVPFSTDSSGGLIAIDPATGTTAHVFPFTPGAADNSGFKEGNGLDPNGFITDAAGNANFIINLNYNIFNPAVAPVVLRPGTIQTTATAVDSTGACAGSSGSATPSFVDSGYMRVYNTSAPANAPNSSPSFQLTNGPLKPVLVRGNVIRLTLAEHFDGLTHGHLPGLNVPGSMCGDWAARLTGPLSAAVSAN